jgi:hypothetical protein
MMRGIGFAPPMPSPIARARIIALGGLDWERYDTPHRRQFSPG